MIFSKIYDTDNIHFNVLKDELEDINYPLKTYYPIQSIYSSIIPYSLYNLRITCHKFCNIIDYYIKKKYSMKVIKKINKIFVYKLIDYSCNYGIFFNEIKSYINLFKNRFKELCIIYRPELINNDIDITINYIYISIEDINNLINKGYINKIFVKICDILYTFNFNKFNEKLICKKNGNNLYNVTDFINGMTLSVKYFKYNKNNIKYKYKFQYKCQCNCSCPDYRCFCHVGN